MQILVLVDKRTPRLQYITKHILYEMLGFEVILTQNSSEFESFVGPKICYSKTKSINSITITPHPFLSLNGFFEQSFAIINWKSLPTFFHTDENADIPFDLFAASFFLLTRYEEYYSVKDEHGRFCARDSVAYKNNFLNMPLVDLWVNELRKIIAERFPGSNPKIPGFRFVPTIDIDNAFAYLHKDLLRQTVGFASNILKMRLHELLFRFQVIAKIKNDPYDSYQKLFSLLEGHPDAIWFILGGKRGKYDRNISLESKQMKVLVGRIAERFRIGIHPSYASDLQVDRVKNEHSALEKIAKKRVSTSRQHYLRVNLPHTYRILSSLGICEDYSMGYSNEVGFRASTCTPFQFYDLLSEKVLPLTIVPFQVMDRALLNSYAKHPEKAVEEALVLASRVKQVGGTFVLAWHNETLSGINEWSGWETVFERIVKGSETLT